MTNDALRSCSSRVNSSAKSPIDRKIPANARRSVLPTTQTLAGRASDAGPTTGISAAVPPSNPASTANTPNTCAGRVR